LTAIFDAPIDDDQNSITMDVYGSILLQDVQIVQKIVNFNRKHIPE